VRCQMPPRIAAIDVDQCNKIWQGVKRDLFDVT